MNKLVGLGRLGKLGMMGGVMWYPHTLTLQPDAAAGNDTWITVDFPTNNNGTTTTLVAGGLGVGGNVTRGMLRFDLSSIPATARNIAATVTLYCESEQDTSDRNVGLHRAITQWYEGAKSSAPPDVGQDGSTWNLRNSNGTVAWAGGAGGGSGTDYAAVATDTKLIDAAAKAFNYTVTADVVAWVSGAASNYGWWIINASEATADSRKRFTSSDGLTAGNRPKIVVTYQSKNP